MPARVREALLRALVCQLALRHLYVYFPYRLVIATYESWYDGTCHQFGLMHVNLYVYTQASTHRRVLFITAILLFWNKVHFS